MALSFAKQSFSYKNRTRMFRTPHVESRVQSFNFTWDWTCIGWLISVIMEGLQRSYFKTINCYPSAPDIYNQVIRSHGAAVLMRKHRCETRLSCWFSEMDCDWSGSSKQTSQPPWIQQNVFSGTHSSMYIIKLSTVLYKSSEIYYFLNCCIWSIVRYTNNKNCICSSGILL